MQRNAPPSPRLLAVAVVSLLLCACSSRMPETAPPAAPAAVRYVPGAEPEPSPLARLMRGMTTFTDSTGKRLSKGDELLAFPSDFKDLLTAEPTPGMVDRRTFDPYAQAWLHQLDSLYTTAPANRTEVYNALVGTCAACHGNMCPGPLSRIKKLSIPEEER